MSAAAMVERKALPGSGQPAARSPKKLPRILKLLLLYLAAITILGKGPTYIGVGVLYWGEITLFLSLCWVVKRIGRLVFPTLRIRTLSLLICAFIVLGAIESAINYPIWGLDTLRDSAIWYYSLFYFIGVAIASDGEESSRFCSAWKGFFVAAVGWTAAEYLTGMRLDKLLPELQRGHGSVLSNSGLEVVQNMGLGCMVLLAGRAGRTRLGNGWRSAVALIGLAVVAVFATSRSAKIAVAAALAVNICISVAQRSAGRAFRRRAAVVLALLIVAGLGAVAFGADLRSRLAIDRFESLSLANPTDTAAWREDWWADLYAAVMARNPFFGLGFGVNLADFNPVVYDEGGELPLRSPHNFNMTIFSRMGIVGAALWTAILFFGLMAPLWDTMTASTEAERAEASRRTFWIVALVAIWVNSSFSVLMEGPVAGIPFWLILGLVAGRPISRRRRFAIHAATNPVPVRQRPPIRSRLVNGV